MKVITYRQWDGTKFRYWGVGKNGTFVSPDLSVPSDILTPLRDDSGIELWENDIAEIEVQNEFGSFTKVVAPLVFEEKTAQFLFSYDSLFDVRGIVKVKKVGNVYQQKELLKN